MILGALASLGGLSGVALDIAAHEVFIKLAKGSKGHHFFGGHGRRDSGGSELVELAFTQ